MAIGKHKNFTIYHPYSGIFPGQTNNAMNGLCERICIQATKVFDACLNQSQIEMNVLPKISWWLLPHNKKCNDTIRWDIY